MGRNARKEAKLSAIMVPPIEAASLQLMCSLSMIAECSAESSFSDRHINLLG